MSNVQVAENSKPVSIAIVDDDARICQFLSRLIGTIPGVCCNGVYCDVPTALDGFASKPADVVLLDIGLPGITGLEAIEPILESHPQSRILMHSNYDDEEKIMKAWQAGASGYVLKNQDTSSLKRAIDTVLNGNTIWPHGYEELMTSAPSFSLLGSIRVFFMTLIGR